MNNQNNETVYAGQSNAEQQQNSNPSSNKKHFFKESLIAKILGSATIGIATGAGSAYAAEHIILSKGDSTVQEADTNKEQAQAQPTNPTVEERLTALEEKEKVRTQQEEYQHREAEQEQQKADRQHNIAKDQPHRQEESETEDHKPDKEESFFDKHEVKIEGTYEEPLEDGGTALVYTGTVDGHDAQFLIDSQGRVVAAAIDSNDNGAVDEEELIDLRSQQISSEQLLIYRVVENPDTEITVVEVHNNVETESGTMDIALLSVNGRRVVLVDADQNGEVDVIASDDDNNGHFEDNEFSEVSTSHIEMPTQDDINTPDLTHNEGGMQDYSNNADTTIYEA